MRITAIRIGKLESGPGFNNRRFEAEATVDDGEEPEVVSERLEAFVDQNLRQSRRLADLRESVRDLMQTSHDLQETIERQRIEMAANVEAIQKYEQLGALARERGLVGSNELSGDLPF